MKLKTKEWQPLELVDREAMQPLHSLNRGSTHGGNSSHRYYTLNGTAADATDDSEEEMSEVEFIDPLEKAEQKREGRRNKFLLLLVLAVVMIACLTAVLVWQHAVNRRPQKPDVCNTKECVTGSAYIIHKMDTNVDPCYDFYNYSCGSWAKNTVIPPSKAKYGSFAKISDEIEIIMREIVEKTGSDYKGVHSTAIEKTRQFYRICMDEASIEKNGTDEILKLIRQLGSWTVTSDPLSGTWDASNWNRQETLLKAQQLHSSPLISVSVGADDKNSTNNILSFDQAGLSLSDPRDYFPNKTNYEDLREAFIKFAASVGVALGADNSSHLQQQMEDIYEFQQQLAQIFVPSDELLDPVKNYHKMTLQVFQTSYLGTWLDIKQFLEGLIGRDVDMTQDVLVYTPSYFLKLDTLIRNTSQEVLANYLVWYTLEGRVGYMPSAFIDAALELDKVERGITELPDRWKRCLHKVYSVLGFASGALYVEQHFTQESKDEVESLFDAVRRAFIDNLPSVSWMDEKTRDYAIDKAEAVATMLGYPTYIVNPAKLDEHYENLTIVDGDFFSTSLSISRFYRQRNMKKLGEPHDKTEWSMHPATVNGYYSTTSNQIVFPAGILRPPLFNPTFPRSFNFGSFGMIVGHELTHGFDNRGRNYDKDGNMVDWWTKHAEDEFERHTECYVNQYSQFTSQGVHLDGKMTLSENIADNGGMKIAYLAYQKWLAKAGKDSLVFPGIDDFTPDQLFFIGMAQLWCSHYTDEYAQVAIETDSHSIAKFRVSNSLDPEEASIIGVSSGSKLFAHWITMSPPAVKELK